MEATPQATIVVSGSPLVMFPSTYGVTNLAPGIMTLANTSSVVARDIAAVIPASLGDTTQNAQACQTLQPGASCQIQFSPDYQSHPATSITISGSNTNTVNASIAITWPYVVGGNVTTSAFHAASNTLFVGGDFPYVGPVTGSLALLDTTTGSLKPGMAMVDGNIFYAISDSANGYYIAGQFERVAGENQTFLAHILADGSFDTTWRPSLNALARALYLDGTTLYVGGDFTEINGQTRNRLAAFDTITGNLTSFSPQIDNGFVSALTAANGLLFVGGTFTTIASNSYPRIAAFDTTTGNIQASFNPGASGRVRTLGVFQNRLYVGGEFATIASTSRRALASFDISNINAISLTSFDPGIGPVNAQVRNLQVVAGRLYAGGTFTTANTSATRNRLAAWNIDGANTLSFDSTWNPNANSPVGTITVGSSAIYVGGDFTSIGGVVRARLAALSPTTGAPDAWNPGASASVFASAPGNAEVMFGGSFTSSGAGTHRNLAAINTATGVVINWKPMPNSFVNDLLIDGNRLYVAGNFTNFNNGADTRNYIAAFNTASLGLESWTANPNNTVNSMALDGTRLYIGGQFSQVDGQARTLAAALDTTLNSGNLITAWNPNISGISAIKLLVDASRVYVGGNFSLVDGQARNALAALDKANASLITGFNANITGTFVNAMAKSGANLYVGGSFTQIAGQARTNLGSVLLADGSVTSWNPNLIGSVNNISTTGSTLYVMGVFSSITANNRNNIAAFRLSDNSLLAWAPEIIGSVSTINTNGPNAYIGGLFSRIGNTVGMLQLVDSLLFTSVAGS